MLHALRQSLPELRDPKVLRGELLAGLTVGIIALPLSMALAIASGVPPQHGLYTAMVAGALIALGGGSRVNISGPTAAFVVVLLPIVQQYGIGGLLVSGFMAGLILLAMGFGRLGRLIEVVPYPVTIGFTAGIGVVIATLQVKDLLGLELEGLQGHYLDKLGQLLMALPSLAWRETLIAALTFAVLLVWPRLRSRIPGHLVALLVGSLAAWLLGQWLDGFEVATIGSRFSYMQGEVSGHGIPPFLPGFAWPWELAGADGAPIGLSYELVHTLLGGAITIAVLGALESLLCAVVADGMSGRKHDPNDELIGQGIGNLVAPLFGGIPATAAIARTTANIRAGAVSPLSAVVHSGFILLAILLLAPILAYIPMASMAALLLMVAWNMSEARHFLRTLRIAPRDDVLTLLTCFALTVLFDMTIAVAVGMGLAGMLFIRRSIELTEVATLGPEVHDGRFPPEVVVYDINGPLFFGSAQKALNNITRVGGGVRVVVLDMTEVSMIDMSAIVAMESIVSDLRQKGVLLILHRLQKRMQVKLLKAGVSHKPGEIAIACSLDEAQNIAEQFLGIRSSEAEGSSVNGM